MKKLFLSLIVLMAAATASAQWAVTDAGNLSQNLKTSRSCKTGRLPQGTEEQAGRKPDLMRKVNSVVSDCETTRYIIERQARLSQKCVDLVSGKQLNSSTLKTLTGSVEQIMAGNRRLIQLSRTILSTSVKMNDAERLSTLQNIEKQTLEEERKIAKISQIISQYERLKRAFR